MRDVLAYFYKTVLWHSQWTYSTEKVTSVVDYSPPRWSFWSRMLSHGETTWLLLAESARGEGLVFLRIALCVTVRKPFWALQTVGFLRKIIRGEAEQKKRCPKIQVSLSTEEKVNYEKRPKKYKASEIGKKDKNNKDSELAKRILATPRNPWL